MLEEFIAEHRLDKGFKDIAQTWYIPLCNQLQMHRISAKQPFFLGINGCQGSGKSTLTAFICDYLSQQGLKVVILSLDDFYLDKDTRQKLASNVHPLLATRGVPGTHNTDMIMQTLTGLAEQQAVRVPRFDKATDNPIPLAQWPSLGPPYDLVIFEGWCWGVMPQRDEQLIEAVNDLEAEQDPDCMWRAFVNEQLQHHYVPGYAMMDAWLMLKAPGFDVVYQWRKEQEHKLRDKAGGGAGVMSDEEVLRFIMHYQRLTECSLETLPTECNWVFTLNEHRKIVSTTGMPA